MVLLSSVVRDVRHGRQIVIVAAVVLALALVGILAITLAGISMNRDAANAQVQLVDNSLSKSVVDALNDLQTVAFWDTTVEKLRPGHIDKAWLDVEIGEYLTKAAGHDAVWILDSQDRPIYGYSEGRRMVTAGLPQIARDLDALVAIIRTGHEDKRRIRDTGFRSNQSRYAQISHGGARGRWTSHIVAYRGEAVVLSVMTIVPITDQSKLRGRPYLLVSLARVGQKQLREFATALLIPDLQARPLSAPARLSGVYVVTTDEGTPIQRYEWTTRAPGRILLHYVLPLFIIVTLIATGLLMVTLRRMQKITLSLVEKEREASFLANYDPLSSLPNRRLFARQLDVALQPDRSRYQRTVLAFCDVDNFKTINDTLGHAVGDELIKEVARRLRDGFPDCILVARFGGDEFALMHSEKWLSVEEFGARIQSIFEAPVDLAGVPTLIGISVGIAIAPDHSGDATDLMRNADIALYDAKDAGRSRCVVYHRGMGDQILIRKEREARILEMLRAERFELHYQPIVDIRGARVSGMEALLRWPTDDALPMPPGEFIPIAESAGFMPELGDWVIRRAFSDSLRWPDLWISINLSPLQIEAPGLLDQLSKHLRATGADPARIVFEVTEGLLLQSTEKVRKTLHGLNGMGFKMSLDDFGTGYSSLSYLQEFTFDKLKIDRSFICDGKLENHRSASLVKAVIDVGRALGIELVAEGVEHMREAVTLKLLGCDQIQGWLYGRALPPADATEHLKTLGAMLAEAAANEPVPSLRLANI